MNLSVLGMNSANRFPGWKAKADNLSLHNLTELYSPLWNWSSSEDWASQTGS